MGTCVIMLIVILLASALASLVPAGRAAPLQTAQLIPRAHANVTTIEYLTSTLNDLVLFTLPASRRCGGRRKCRGGNASPPPAPPPPPPSRIVQSLVLNRVNTSHYTGLYKLVVEAGWGISIGIYDLSRTGQGWKPGVSATSRASKTCDANWCGIKVHFSAEIPAHLSHRAESLSASQFCHGVASAKTAMANGTFGVPSETDVTVLTTDVYEGEHDVDWVGIIIAGVICLFLIVCLSAILAAACGRH